MISLMPVTPSTQGVSGERSTSTMSDRSCGLGADVDAEAEAEEEAAAEAGAVALCETDASAEQGA